jgi:hypothetical protein
MYQSLIWVLVLGDDARRLGASLDAENRQGLANSLIDGVRRYVEFARDFLRTEVLVDEQQTIELTGTEPGDTLGHQIARTRIIGLARRVMRSVRIVQDNTHPAKHAVLPSRVHVSIYVIF